MNELTTSELRTRIQLEMLLLESGVNSYQLVRIHHTNSNPQHKTSHVSLLNSTNVLVLSHTNQFKHTYMSITHETHATQSQSIEIEIDITMQVALRPHNHTFNIRITIMQT